VANSLQIEKIVVGLINVKFGLKKFGILNLFWLEY